MFDKSGHLGVLLNCTLVYAMKLLCTTYRPTAYKTHLVLYLMGPGESSCHCPVLCGKTQPHSPQVCLGPNYRRLSNLTKIGTAKLMMGRLRLLAASCCGRNLFRAVDPPHKETRGETEAKSTAKIPYS